MLSQPTKSSPHPRLLGSLGRVLEHYYLSGMTKESLLLHEVRSDDPLVSGEEYVDVPSNGFPKLEGTTDFWWNTPPSSGGLVLEMFRNLGLNFNAKTVQLKAPSPPSAVSPSNAVAGLSQGLGQARPRTKVKLKLHQNPPRVTRASPSPLAVNAVEITDGENIFHCIDSMSTKYFMTVVSSKAAASLTPDEQNMGSRKPRGRPKGKKRVINEGETAPPQKAKKFKSSKLIDSNEDTSEAGPSNIAAKEDPRAQSLPSEGPEPPKVSLTAFQHFAL